MQAVITGEIPVEGTHPTNSEPADGDLPLDSTTTGRVQPNGAKATGNITLTDIDVFKVELTGGRTYRIDLKGNVTSDYGGTLLDPYVILYGPGEMTPTSNNNLVTIITGAYLNSAGTNSAGTDFGVEDNDSGEGNNARIELIPLTADPQTYHIEVAGYASQIGTYTLSVTRTK